MGRITFPLGSVAAAIRPAVEAEVRRRANHVKLEAADIAERELGKYDSVRRPQDGPIGAYRRAFAVVDGSKASTRIVHVQVINRDWKANLIEHGSRPHTISPKRAAWLAWKVLGSGEYFSMPNGASVHHPGTEAHKILERAAEAGRR